MAVTNICTSQPLMPPSWDLLQDADQDGMTDIDEILWKMDPLDPADGNSDLDEDRLSLAWEYYLGTDPSLADTDADGWSDWDELLLYGTDPLSAASFPLSSPAPKSTDATTSSPAAPHAKLSLTIPPPPPQPSLDNGDFTDVKFAISKNQLFSNNYQGKGFMWGAGEVGGWTAYVGKTVEVWEAGGEKFVELDGSPGNYGIKQSITNVKAGAYILAWKQSGRNSTKADADPYLVKVYYMNGSTEVPIGQSAQFTNLNKLAWTDKAFGFQITPEHLAAAGGNPIYVAFIPTGRLNTYGTLIDKVSLLPVEIKEVWSNQIADVEVNGFPDKTGRNNQTYSIMGVRNDGKAYIRIKLEYAISAEFRQKILFRLQQPEVSNPGSSSFGPGGYVVDVIAGNVSDNTEINHRVYFGYDRDNDGELSKSEVLDTVYSTANGQNRIPVEFKIVSKTRHEQSRQKNIKFADDGFAGIVPNMAPTGASLIKSFHRALPPNSNNTNATTIDRTGDNRLSHPVGVAFQPTEVPGEAVNGVYNLNHLLAENILKSQPFRNACRDGFDAILPILIKRRENTGTPEGFLTFTWEETVGDPSLNFRLNHNSLPFMPDFDSFLALGRVRVQNARIGFRYDLSAQFVEVYFQGTFKDLYDFDYDDSFDLIVWSADEIRQGAETQAGYPTLTTGGKVFTTQVDIRDGEKYIKTGYSFFLYK